MNRSMSDRVLERWWPLLVACLVALAALARPGRAPAADPQDAGLVFSCAEDNDLYRVLAAGHRAYARCGTAIEAVRAARPGAGVLILADGYPHKTTPLAPEVFDEAARKGLRLYVEYPAALGDLKVSAPRRTSLERVVVARDAFGPSLAKMRILALHDCHLVEAAATDPYLVAAKVAGFDTAVFGLADVKVHPILFEHRPGRILVCTTKLSQFVTARYAPKDAIQAVWRMIFGWLQPGAEAPPVDWQPTVRPSYTRHEPLPPDAARRAIVRGIDWHTTAGMLLDAATSKQYEKNRDASRADPLAFVAPPPGKVPRGDGRFGVLEGFSSQIRYDGKQPVRWWLRSDSNGETSLAFALRSRLDGDPRSRQVAAGLLDWIYFNSGLFQNDPAKGDFGLVHWASDTSSLYADNDVKIILGCLGTAAVLDNDRWDEPLLKNILGNYRTTGIFGYRGAALDGHQVRKRGWRPFWQARTVHYAPHYQCWIWATYLWLYDKTRFEPLLERTRRAIRSMMAAYPDRWNWTNGIQQERGRMMLTLAWLIRVEDRPEYRAWLQRLADDMEKCQDPCGAIREEIAALELGQLRPPKSNAEYGTNEASLIQQNGDPAADLLYTCNFTFLGLHEAHAATGDPRYRRMADRLAEFLLRVQVRSEAHPELDGAWFRAFDFRRWEYWGSNADSGWGAWSIEVGWTQAWIPTVLALRELGWNLWDLSRTSRIARHWQECRAMMLPEDMFHEAPSSRMRHAALDKPVLLANPPDPRYPATGPDALTDGLVGPADHAGPEWLGFWGIDMDATVDLGASTEISRLALRCLQSTSVGILLPKRVEFAVSDDGKQYRVLKTVEPGVSPREPGPLVSLLAAEGLQAKARYVRVRAASVGTLPDWLIKQPTKAWLFADEVLLNPP